MIGWTTDHRELTAIVRVAGLAVGRFAMLDGRPPDQPWMARSMVANFGPGTVPLLDRHGGQWIGWLDDLRAEDADLRFAGWIEADDALVARLRRGVPVSIECAEGREPLPPGIDWQIPLGRPIAESNPAYQGTFGLGMNLLGIAMSDRPAARGSVMWLVVPTD